MRGLMQDGKLEVPQAIEAILRDLESMDRIEPYDDGGIDDEQAQTLERTPQMDSVAEHQPYIEGQAQEPGDYLAQYGQYAERRLTAEDQALPPGYTRGGLQAEMEFRRMSAGEHRLYLMTAIKNRLEKHGLYRTQCVGGQSDLGSSAENSPVRQRSTNQLESIIENKSKSIADALVSDGLNKFYGNFFQQQVAMGSKNPLAQ